jgi:hypothetical protein
MRHSPSLLSLACGLFSAAVCPAQLAWDLVSTPTRPGFGLWPGLAWHAPTGTCIQYGGSNGNATSNETWSYDGSNWTQLFPANNPGARHTFGMCADSQRGVIVLFGGADNSFASQGTTWEYSPSLNTWTQRTSGSGLSPTPRRGCVMVFDSARGVSVLYGGYSGSAFTNDTWEWNGTSWTEIQTPNRPSDRDRCAMAFDSARSRIVLFGGQTSSGASAETWEYDGANWSLVATPTTPPAREKAEMVYIPTRGVMVMQGGQGNGVQIFDCWEYDGLNWRLVPSTPSPARGENGIAYDAVRNTAVVFGGFTTGGVYTETWEYRFPNTARVHSFGTGCIGSGGVPSLSTQGGSVPALGTSLQLEINNLPASIGFGSVLYGLDNYRFGGLWLPLDLGILGWAGCRAYTTPDVSVAFFHNGGTGTTSFQIPPGAQLQGFTLYAQALSFDPGSPNGQFAFSNALELILN